MTQDELKQKVAHAALHYIKDVSIVGVGTGSTVRHFIDYLAEFKSDGALTREKIIGAASKKFICIVDETKCVDVLGAFPLPIEVIPMARSYVAREMVKLGGQPVWRENFITDNHNEIIDVHNLNILDPIELEKIINNITGVVTNGLFAMRAADVVLVGKGTEVITR